MDLKLSKMTVDTTLAQSYLKNFEQSISKINSVYDGKKYYNTLQDYEKVNNSMEKTRLHVKVRNNLVEKLKENMDLLAQLEYLVRKIPIEDTKAQIKIIIQQLNYHYLVYCDWIELCDCSIYMGRDETLLKLGYVAKLLREKREYILIQAEHSVAPLCALFTELCCDAGIPVLTTFVRETPEFIREQLPISVGALSVVCEQSDVDSAVDILLSSSTKAPWRLQRILVQESIWKQFKDVLTWKCNSHDFSKAEYQGREFLLDQPSVKEPQETEVYVHTYRTTKELLSLLNEYPSNYLSLWANNIAEINEITYSVRTPVIWVNNYADFRGPSQISEVFYPFVEFISNQIGFKGDKVRELLKLRQSWLKLTVETRREIVCKILRECDPNELNYLDVDSVMYATNSNCVYAGKDYVCTIVRDESKHFLYVVNGIEAVATASLYETVIYGNAVALDPSEFSETLKKHIGKFKDAGVPIVYIKFSDRIPLGNGDLDVLTLLKCVINENKRDFSRKRRAIWTNSGTIFAN